MSTTKQALPAGLEMQWALRAPNPVTPFASLVLSIHSSLMRCPDPVLRLLLNKSDNPTAEDNSNNTTEILEENWSDSVKVQDSGESVITLEYAEIGGKGRSTSVRIVEVMKGRKVAVVCSYDTSATVIDLAQYVHVGEVGGGGAARLKDVVKAEKVGADLDKVLWEEVVGGLRTRGEPTPPPKVLDFGKIKGPYGSNLTEEQEERFRKEREEKEEAKRREIEDEMRIAARILAEEQEAARNRNILPPRIPVVGGGGLGRSDLDPFGGLGGSGMLMDPRGLRRPQLPGGAGVPPGARFDPFGPVGPFGGGGGGGRMPQMPGFPGRAGGGIPFGMPDPDHETAPHGFDDMFT